MKSLERVVPTQYIKWKVRLVPQMVFHTICGTQ
jgi:hypothetical protein